MLRLLHSSQPVAWGIVPLTAAVLFLVGGLGVHGWSLMAQAPWGAGLAVVMSARWIHTAHLTSGMRTRPNLLPSWSWVLVATPMLWNTPASWWWGMALIWLSVGQGLRLQMGDSRPDLHFWSGLAAGSAPMVASELAAWCPVLAVVLFAWRPPKPGEALLWVVGALTPLWMASGLSWWRMGSLASMEWRWTEVVNAPKMSAWVLVPMAVAGWALRQQSLTRATARQRVTRKWTQWPGPIALAMGVISMSSGWGTGSAIAMALTGFAMWVTWALGWCCPPRWRGTPWVPWLALVLAIGAAWGPV